MPSRARIVGSMVAALVVAAAVALAYSTVATTSARVAASTDNRTSVFGAADIDLAVGDDDPQGDLEQLLFEASGMYPGSLIESCVTVSSASDLPLSVRLHGRRDGGTGLDRYVEVRMETGSGATTGDCTGFVPEAPIFEGPLADLWRDHPHFDQGIVLAEGSTAFSTTLRARATLVDDNAAQGLATTFWVTIEARP